MDVVIGLGEIGYPWYNLISKARKTAAIDVSTIPLARVGVAERMVGGWFHAVGMSDFKSGWLNEEEIHHSNVEIAHICIPYTYRFPAIVTKYFKWLLPKTIVIHSTVKPYTTKNIHLILGEAARIIYSPMRGVHGRMDLDMKRYDKFYASYTEDCQDYVELLTSMGITNYRIKKPETLEFAKVLTDTSYYGFLVAFAMLTEEVTMKHGLDYDEMWMFAYQIHRYLDNRPPCGSPGMNKLYPDPRGIGGHCILPNLELVKEELPDLYRFIHKVNDDCKQRHGHGENDEKP